jgi:hypothetical protein
VKSSDRERQFIVDYMASQASNETVEHLEKVASERVLGQEHDVWDVHTDNGRWWVITGPTNLYSQAQFPSMDIVLSFHVGLMARVTEHHERSASEEQADQFLQAWRKWEQAGEALNEADEAEEFQAIGMRCRESLIAFAREAAIVISFDPHVPAPKASDFVGWTDVITNTIASGASADRRRGYLKSAAKSTWELVNWLTHASTASRFDAYFAFKATGHVLSAFSLAVLRFELGVPNRCPKCSSYKLTTDYRYDDQGNMVHFVLCEACGWEKIKEHQEVQPDQMPGTTNSEVKSKEDLGPCITVDVPLRGPKPPKPSGS